MIISKRQHTIVMLPSEEIAKEDSIIMLEKVFAFNIVSTNTKSMEDLRYENVLTRLNRIDDWQKGMWSTEGYHIRDLFDAGLVKTQHIYILSNEEIKKDDWVLSLENTFNYDKKPYDTLNKIGKTSGRCGSDGWWVDLINSKSKQMTNHELKFRKIIASTDKSLGLPNLGSYFISLFIESYNSKKEEVISRVMVNYDDKGILLGEEYGTDETIISISESKKIWVRKEIEEILLNHTSEMFEALSLKPYPKETLMNYTKKYIENL